MPRRQDRSLVVVVASEFESMMRRADPDPSPQPLTMSPNLTLTPDEPGRRASHPRPAPASRRPAGILGALQASAQRLEQRLGRFYPE